MGMYTEFHYNAAIKEGQHINILRGLMGEVWETPIESDHPLFQTERWHNMLVRGSYYFAGDTASTLRWDHIVNTYTLSVRCNLKNYDNEIEKFIDWIAPFIDDPREGDFLGFMRYEETEWPTLIHYPATLTPAEPTP